MTVPKQHLIGFAPRLGKLHDLPDEAIATIKEIPALRLRHRLHWRIASIRTCPTHRIPLSDVREGKWHEAVHELQTINQAARTTEAIGGLLAFDPNQKASGVTEKMWNIAGRTAWPLIVEGSDGIRDMLAQRLKGCWRQNGPPSPWKAFGMHLSRVVRQPTIKEPRSDPRDRPRCHHRQRPIDVGVIAFGYAGRGTQICEYHFHRQGRAYSFPTLTNVMRAAGGIDDMPTLEGARNVEVVYSRAKTMIEEAKHAVPATHVLDILNTSASLVSALIELNQLIRIQDHVADVSKVGNAIDGRSIQP